MFRKRWRHTMRVRGAVARYNGVPPYAETRSYVNRVIKDYKKRTASDE